MTVLLRRLRPTQRRLWPQRLSAPYTTTAPRRSLVFNPDSTPENALPPAELSRLIEAHSRQPPRPLTLSTLLSFAGHLTPEAVLSSAGYVFAEIPRRLAMRARMLESLPFIVCTNPFIARTLDAHRRSFQFLASYPPVRTLEENAQFIEQLEVVVRNHADDIPAMAKGFQECTRYMTAEQISEFLDNTIRNRIAVRLIAEQHIAISRDLASADRGADHLGVVHMACSPKQMIRQCGSFVSELCEATLGASPPILIDGDADATFAHVPVHLEYILTEVLKNSFRATVEWHQKHHAAGSAAPLPPVVITISSTPRTVPAPAPSSVLLPTMTPTHSAAPAARFLHLRVRDAGGGVPAANMSRIFSYSFTTAGRGAARASKDSWDDGGPYAAQHVGGGGGDGMFGEIASRGVQTGMGTIAGLGYGLPMSRLYAQYFGGSFDFKSLDGWGSDVFIKLRCLDDGGDVEI